MYIDIARCQDVKMKLEKEKCQNVVIYMSIIYPLYLKHLEEK